VKYNTAMIISDLTGISMDVASTVWDIKSLVTIGTRAVAFLTA
jgi:hypothetical protein